MYYVTETLWLGSQEWFSQLGEISIHGVCFSLGLSEVSTRKEGFTKNQLIPLVYGNPPDNLSHTFNIRRKNILNSFGIGKLTYNNMIKKYEGIESISPLCFLIPCFPMIEVEYHYRKDIQDVPGWNNLYILNLSSLKDVDAVVQTLQRKTKTRKTSQCLNSSELHHIRFYFL